MDDLDVHSIMNNMRDPRRPTLWWSLGVERRH
jgi:hypothetical protein